MATAQSSDPFATFAFVVAIDGIATGFFQEVSGLTAQIDIQEVQEGGRNNTTRKLVGQGKFPNLVLKRGFANSTLLDALMNFHNNKNRLDGTITLRSAKGDDVASWEFKNGIPVKWDGPQLNVSQNAIAIESLEIAHEGLVAYTTATVDRTGSVESVSSGPPSESSGLGPGASPYEENNVNAPVAMPPEPNAPNAAAPGAGPGDGGANVDGNFMANGTDAVNTEFNANGGSTFEAVNTSFELEGHDHEISDWQQWGDNANNPNDMLTWDAGGVTTGDVTNTEYAMEGREGMTSEANALGPGINQEMLMYGDAASLLANAANAAGGAAEEAAGEQDEES